VAQRPRRKLFFLAALLAALILLAACAAAPAAQPVSAPSPTAALSPTGAPAASAQAEAQTCEAGFRSFDHELLASDPLCIPEAPARIIALDMASVELTLLSEKTLLATSGWILSELPLLAPQFAPALETVEDVGYPANLEQIALLKPDLILAVGGTTAGEAIDVEQAQVIAPVVLADPAIYNDWKLGMRLWSDVLNVPDTYAKMTANYQQRVAELQAALGEGAQREVSVVATSTYGVSLWMPDTPPGAILSDVGLGRPASQRLVGEAAAAEYGMAQYVTVSEERLDLADGDAIFFFSYASSDAETAAAEDAHLAAFVQKPIWQSLGAVKAGQAFLVPGYWWRSQTYILANRVIDDLFTHLTDTSATTPAVDP
jgi:iron complex transport system substrate-binding protein